MKRWRSDMMRQAGQRPRRKGERPPRRGREGLRLRTIPAAALARFLDVTPGEDLAVSTALAELIARAGLGPKEDLDRQRLLGLEVDEQALALAAQVAAGLRRCPEAAESGITADALDSAQEEIDELDDLEARIAWLADKVRTGKRVLETWQREAQRLLLAALLKELAAARTEEEFMDIMGDAATVLDLEEQALAERVKTRRENRAAAARLAAQKAALDREILFLKTMQDLREGRRPPPEVLEAVAAYYAEHHEAEEA